MDEIVARALALAEESFIAASGPGGQNVLAARRYRTQEMNREDARARLAALIEQALVEPKKRARSRVNRVGKEQRIKSKKARGTVKSTRGKVEG